MGFVFVYRKPAPFIPTEATLNLFFHQTKSKKPE